MSARPLPINQPAEAVLRRTASGLAVLFLSGLIAVTAPAAAAKDGSKIAALPPPGDPYGPPIAEAAHRFNIPPAWILAVMQVESDRDAAAVSRKGALGLMQLMPATWAELRLRHRLGNDPFDPRDNILAGSAYLRELHDRYGPSGFLAAYNAGPARYEDYLAGRPLPAETYAYIARLRCLIGGDATAGGMSTTALAIRTGTRSWKRAALFVALFDGNNTPGSLIPARARSDGRPASPMQGVAHVPLGSIGLFPARAAARIAP